MHQQSSTEEIGDNPSDNDNSLKTLAKRITEDEVADWARMQVGVVCRLGLVTMVLWSIVKRRESEGQKKFDISRIMLRLRTGRVGRKHVGSAWWCLRDRYPPSRADQMHND